jgi:hypothetical protein
MTTPTHDELAAMAKLLSPAQRKLLAWFHDGQSHRYLHFKTGEALRRRDYLVRISTCVTRDVWARGDKVIERDYVPGHWRHEWDTTPVGFHLARWLKANP